ncbi:MAG: FAD-binding oxidoreductase, partial [Nocardioidaceae bacterium]
GVDRQPAVIVRAVGSADVSTAVKFAHAHDLEVSVRGGAHGTSGSCVTDSGVMIDLSLMREVTVDPVNRRCQVQGGATLAERDAATQAFGLATTAGIVGHTGVGGLTLGGGMGWLTRKAGLSVDNLVAAEVVVADGRVLHASPAENSDLFWAVRGGGGNFGVVTRFDFRLHPVGPVVQFGLFFCPLERGPEVLRFTRDLFPGLSRDTNVIVVGLNAPPEPFVPEKEWFRPGYAVLVTAFGAEDEHAAVVTQARQELSPLFELVTPLPYVELQQLFDEANAFGVFAYDKALYLPDLTEEAIAVIAEQMPRKTSPRSAVFLYRLDGAYCDVAEDETAFGGVRTPQYVVFLVAIADTVEMMERDRDWVRAFWDVLLPHAHGIGSYVNGEAEFPDDRVRATYGPKYERLADIKRTYDPDNVFHLNANIHPAAAG